jgi:hypothetical protein
LASVQAGGSAETSQDTDVKPVEMRHYKSAEWNFELDVPQTWNRFPPVSSNSPFEVTRFLSNENGVHNLIVFRNPYDPAKGVSAYVDQSEQSNEKAGFANFIRGETTIGSKAVMTLQKDMTLKDGKRWYTRQYFITDGTVIYVLGFGTTNPDVMFPIDDRVAKTFVAND